MKLFEFIRLALTEIFQNKARTFLTLIGIIIGIAAVIIIVFIVQGAETYVMTELGRVLPVDLMLVYGRYNPDSGRLLGSMTKDDISYLEEILGEDIRAIAPRYWYSDKLRHEGKEYDCDLIPTTASFQEIYGLRVAKGRFLNELDNENLNQVIVLGYETGETLFKDEDPLNKKVTLFGMTFRVIGVLPKDYQSPIVNVSMNNSSGYIPISVMERLSGIKESSFNLFIRTKDRSLLPTAMIKVREILDSRHGLAADGGSKFVVMDYAGDIESISILKNVLMILMGGVASITLLVAGIGVMNIMLVIITERTKEIGLRKALGATRKDILLQFIIESIILCLVGGILGIIVGCLGSEAILDVANRHIEIETTVPLWAILISLLFTTGIGLFFGIYPALKASRLDPIEALHYE